MEGFSWSIKRQLETKKEAKANGNGNGNEIITGVRGRKGAKGGMYGHYIGV